MNESALTERSSPERPITAVLAGRQNSGKTSILMHMTGTGQRPVNFAGTSVERVEATVQVGERTLRAVDLPGIGSLQPATRDEEVAVDYLRAGGEDAPDVICAVLDASKLSVELRLLEQLCTLSIPVVVALNKTDVARRRGRQVDTALLSSELGLAVVETDALRGEGVAALRTAILAAAGGGAPPSEELDPDAIEERVSSTLSGARGLGERVDAIVMHRWLGLPLLMLVMLGVFQLIFIGADPFMGLIEAGQEGITGAVEARVEPGALQSFLVHGLINGLGSIFIFLPQIILLIAVVALLEGSGYMARAAFLLDRVLSRVGLSGRSFVPMMSSFACAVPGILASRIIDDERDRLATVAVAPLMSCAARLPVYVVLIGAFFPAHQAGLVLFSLYAMGIVLAAAVAWALRRTVLKGGRSLLMMELPAWQRPSPRVVAWQVWMASREFMALAGSVIFATAVVIWLVSYYPRPAALHETFEARRAATVDDAEKSRIDDLEARAYLEQSYLATAGKAITPIFEPAGFDWRVTVGVLSAFPARELIIPTLGILYSVGEVDPGDYEVSTLAAANGASDGLRQNLRAATDADGRPVFGALTAFALMVFFALCSQCMATLATIRRETRSWRWPIFVFTYMTVLAWVAAVLVYQVGGALGFGPPR